MASPHTKQRVQWIGFFLGPLLACLALALLPGQYELPSASGSQSTEFSWAGRATLAVMIWMGTWWLCEAVEISVTALLPIAIFPLLGISTVRDACSPYADPLIFLYFGGFVIALSMERWGLGKRAALLTLRAVGTTASRMIAGFMIVTAVLSAFVSNTATTAMMLPIALSVIALVKGAQNTETPPATNVRTFGICLLLCIAYSASVGGIMTIIGTPTNGFLISFMRESIAEPYRTDVTFLTWLPVGLSLVLVFLPIIYFVMTRFLFPIGDIALPGGEALISKELKELGKVSRGEANTLLVFILAVAAWLCRPWLAAFQFSWNGSSFQPLAGINDSVIAMTAAVLLFLLPCNLRSRQFTMNWETAAKMPWGILFLFGGGLSLAKAVSDNGVAEFIGCQTQALGSLPVVLLILVVVGVLIFLTELTSNAATTASLVPVLAAMAPALNVHPYLLIIPATIAASCAFMLPVATPPNAIVFGSGELEISDMARAGITLNLIAILIVTGVAMLVVKPYFGL